MAAKVTDSPYLPDWRYDPFKIATNNLISFYKWLFSHCTEGFGRWNDNAETSEIIITGASPVKAMDVVDKGRAIIVQRTPAQFANLSLDNMVHTNFKTGSRVHSDLSSCAAIIHCLSSTPDEASRIGSIVYLSTRMYKRPLQKKGMHRVGEEMVLGSPTDPGEIVSGDGADEITDVVVQSPFVIQHLWKAEKVGYHTLKAIKAHAQVGGEITQTTQAGKD